MVVLRTTDLLSPSMRVGAEIGMPSMRKLHSTLMASSAAILAAAISDPQVLVSAVVCLLDVDLTTVPLTRIGILVTDRRVTLSLAWSASTKTVILADRPRSSGGFGGGSKHASGQKLCHPSSCSS